LEILRVTKADADKLLEIYGYYVSETAISFEYDVPTIEEFENRIENISSRYPYIKAVADGEIIGYAYANVFKGRKAYDWSVETTVYVRKDNRQSGIGRALYTELEKQLKGMGILNMNACITVPQKEDSHLTNDSQLFHAKMGFTPVGTFHNSGYKFDTWYDMMWMEKSIGEHDNPSDVTFGKYSK